MSATLQFVKRITHRCMRPFKAAVKLTLRYLIRRISTKFAADILPLEELAAKVDELANRQDRQEGFHWDHAALARRLAVIEDQIDKLHRPPARIEERGAHEEAPNERPVIRLVPGDAERAIPLVLERQYRWEKTG